MTTTTIQQASAARVGPNCAADAQVGECDENQLTQGGIGEFYSKVGRDTHYGGISGKGFGESLSNNAKSDSEVIGANTAYYASRECHSDRVANRC